MSLDLAFDDGQQAIAAAVEQFCTDQCGDDIVRVSTGRLPMELWQGLAGLGVFGVLTPDGGGGALEVVAAVEPLGRAAFPGPLAATFVATWLLDDPLRAPIASGKSIVSLGTPPLLPFGLDADVFLEVDRAQVFRAAPVAGFEPVEMLGGETWARGALERGAELSDATNGLLLARLVRAAQLAAMGRRLVDDASQHAAARKQFGRPIGDFQAVSHPLAECRVRLDSAATLARAAAFYFDATRADEAARFASAAHLSATDAALDAAYVVHQVFGAVGITLEGPVFHISRRIRQLANEAPSRDDSRSLLLGAAA